MSDQATKSLTNTYSVFALAVFCSILWGSAFPTLKVSYAELGMTPDDLTAKIVFAGIRFMLAAFLLLVFVFLTNPKQLKLPIKKIPLVVVLGLLSTSLQYFFFYNGLANTTGMKAAILVSSGTFFVVILAPLFYKDDRLTWQKSVGLIAGFSGIVAVNWGESFSFAFSFIGEGFLLTAALVSTFGTLLAKKLSQSIHPVALTGWQMFSGSLLMLCFGVPNLESDAMTFTPTAWVLLVYAALLSAVAFAIWFSLLKYNHASEVSIYKFVVPIAGTALSALFIPGEALSTSIIGALLLVAIGIFSVNFRRKRHYQRDHARDAA